MTSRRTLMVAAWLLGSLAVALVTSAAERGDYDHFQHGFDLDGAHAGVACESCHVRATFAGTPRQCEGCHDGTGLIAASALPPDHIATTRQCEACHVTADWSAVYEVDHFQVLGSCAGCHNGIQAGGMPVDHPQTSAACDSCHNTVAWGMASFDHAGITSGCFQCHNGMDATGKHPTHIVSSNECEACHTTNAWTPAGFDHSSVMPGTCSSCHDGMTATGKHPGHIATSGECDLCHSTAAWLPAGFDHSTITGSCSTCHDGTQATGMPPGHFQTIQECDYCHTTDFWTPDVFMHGSAGYPGDHRGNLACTECHGGNSDAVTWPFAGYAPDCAGCHANDFRSGPHKKHENPDLFYTVSELRDCSGSCHVYDDATLSTIKEFRPGPEHRVSDGDFD